MQKHNDATKNERTQFFRKIYLSLYWKGCVWEGVGDRTKTATYWSPNSSGYHSLSFPFSWAAQPGDQPLLGHGSHSSIFSPTLWTSCRRGYIIISRPPTSCERHNSHSIQPLDNQGCPWYLRPDAPIIYTGAFLLLTAWPGSICNMWSSPSLPLPLTGSENTGYVPNRTVWYLTSGQTNN